MIEYTDEQHDSLIRGHRKQLADAQATVEALRRERDQWKEAFERSCDDTAHLKAALDAEREKVKALQRQVTQLDKTLADVYAQRDGLQRERDEANSHVKFLGATKQANGSFCLDMKKYHAGHRCGRHRDDPWQGIDTEIDCFVCLKQALDAERELSAARAEKAREYELELYGDPQNFHGRGRTIGVREHLSQLQALVRALPNLEHFDVGVDDHGGEIRLPDGYILFTATSRNRTHALEKLLKYRATLDATTPAVCPDCDGDGAVDSGGTDPNGNPLMRRCGCREKGGDGE